MRKIVSILLLLASSALIAQEANSIDTVAFVANFYTRQSNNLSGTYSKKTGDGEKGEVKISTSSNIKYIVNPPDFSIKPNEEKTWQGFIMPDDISIPIPGTSDYGWLKGDYDLSFKSTNSDDPFSNPQIINSKGTESMHFMIYSLNVNFDCNEDMYLFSGQSIDVNSIAFPSGGNYNWNSPIGVKAVGDFSSPKISVEPENGSSEGSIKLTYEIKGVLFTKTLHIHVLKPQIPEVIYIDSTVKDIHLFNEETPYNFSFTSVGNGFFVKKSGNDQFLISTTPTVVNIDDDPFNPNNLFFKSNKDLGFEYPNLKVLEAGQDENAPLPENKPSSENQQVSNTNVADSDIKYSPDANTLTPEKIFSKPISIALKANPSVIIGKIIVKVD